jgi:hypothetical protein
MAASQRFRRYFDRFLSVCTTFKMRANSVFLAAGCLFATSALAAPAQIGGASHLAGKSQSAHPPSNGLVVIGGSGGWGGGFPDDDPLENDDGGDFVIGPGPFPPPVPP